MLLLALCLGLDFSDKTPIVDQDPGIEDPRSSLSMEASGMKRVWERRERIARDVTSLFLKA